MLEDELSREIKSVESKITALKLALDSSPKGSLNIYRGNDAIRYYQYSGEDKTRKYLGKGNNDVIAGLAQKKYDAAALKILSGELDLLNELASYDAKGRLLKIASEMPDEVVNLVKPLIVDDDTYASLWEARPFTEKQIDESSALLTERGDLVRSKSEVIIANSLLRAGVPYRYECPLRVMLPSGPKYFHPDFTVLNKRTREVFYWEHFGMMDDEEYRHSAFEKMDSYAYSGFFPGKKMIYTFEGAKYQFNTRTIGLNIEAYLL